MIEGYTWLFAFNMRDSGPPSERSKDASVAVSLNRKYPFVIFVPAHMSGKYANLSIRRIESDFIFPPNLPEGQGSPVIGLGGTRCFPSLIDQLIQHMINRLRPISLIHDSSARQPDIPVGETPPVDRDDGRMSTLAFLIPSPSWVLNWMVTLPFRNFSIFSSACFIIRASVWRISCGKARKETRNRAARVKYGKRALNF